MKKKHIYALSLVAAGAFFVCGVAVAACKSNDKKTETVHTHTFDRSQWCSDSQKHWRKSTCGHDVILEYAHEYDGAGDVICNVCGYDRFIPAVQPDVSEPTEDEPVEELPKEEDDKPTESESPFVALRLKAGVTSQIQSATDKLSAGWVFERVRENGESEEVPAGSVTFEPLDTLTVGVHGIAVSFGGLSCTVEYTITPRPEIVKGIDVSLKESVNTVTDGGNLILGTDDFYVEVFADGEYSLCDSWLIYEGQSLKSVSLAPSGDGYSITYAVRIEYTVDGEKIDRQFDSSVVVYVTEKHLPVEPTEPEPVEPVEPTEPEPVEPVEPIEPEPVEPVEPTEPDPVEPVEPVKDDLIVDGAVMDYLCFNGEQVVAGSAAGSITLAQGEGVTPTVENCEKTIEGASYTKALTLNFEAGVCYVGLSFKLERAATFKISLSSSAFHGLGIAENGGDYNLVTEAVMVDGDGMVLSCNLEAGDYCLFLLDEAGASLYIYSIEIIFN